MCSTTEMYPRSKLTKVQEEGQALAIALWGRGVQEGLLEEKAGAGS